MNENAGGIIISDETFKDIRDIYIDTDESLDDIKKKDFLLTASPDELMSSAVTLHINGDYEGALERREVAFSSAIFNNNDIVAGHAARDIAATYERMANNCEADPQKELELLNEALIWAQKAKDFHAKVLQESETHNREELRQISATEAQVARVGMHKVLKLFKNGNNDPELNNQTYKASAKSRQYFKEANKQATGVNRVIDQWQINSITTHSLVESELGSRKRGFWLGVQGVLMSVFSESKLLDTSGPDLTTRERFGAKKKAFLRNMGAVTVSVFGQKADNIAQKVV